MNTRYAGRKSPCVTDAEILAEVRSRRVDPRDVQEAVQDAFYDLRERKGIKERYTSRSGYPCTKLGEERLFRLMNALQKARP